MIGFVVFSMKRAWQGFWRNAVMSLAATATMVLMLLLLAGFWIIQTGLLAGLDFTEQKVEVVAYLQPNATDSQVTELTTKLKAMPQIASVDYVSRDEALGPLPGIAQGAGSGGPDPVPRREPAVREPRGQDGRPLAGSRRRRRPRRRSEHPPGDQHRGPGRPRPDRDRHPAHGRAPSSSSIVGVIALFIIINTIRLAVLARADEIEVMRLVGASDAFIRWPFVFEGAFVGFLGAVVTLGILLAVADPLSAFMADFFRVLPLQFGSLTRDLVALVMGAGVGLGILGSWLSVQDLPHPLDAQRRRTARSVEDSSVAPQRDSMYPSRLPPGRHTQDGRAMLSEDPPPPAADRPASVDPPLPAPGPVAASDAPDAAPRQPATPRPPTPPHRPDLGRPGGHPCRFRALPVGLHDGSPCRVRPRDAGLRGDGLPAVLGHVPHHPGSLRRRRGRPVDADPGRHPGDDRVARRPVLRLSDLGPVPPEPAGHQRPVRGDRRRSWPRRRPTARRAARRSGRPAASSSPSRSTDRPPRRRASPSATSSRRSMAPRWTG